MHWKRKLIFKSRRNEDEDEFGEEELLTIKLYRYLMGKMHSAEECRLIALSLKDQIVSHKANKLESLKRVIEWISASNP